MSRGSAKFTTGKPIDSQLSSDFSQPNYSKKLDPVMDFEGKNRNVKGSCEELDPIRAINKAFDIDDEDMVVKTSTLNIRSEARNYDSADSDWRKHENAIKNERQAKLVPELKKNQGKVSESFMKRVGELSSENSKLRDAAKVAEKKLTRGKLGVAAAIPLVASGIAGAYKYGQKNAEKGIKEVDNGIETKGVAARALTGGAIGSLVGSKTSKKEDESGGAIRGAALGAALGAAGGIGSRAALRANAKKLYPGIKHADEAPSEFSAMERVASGAGSAIGGVAGGLYGRKSRSKEKSISENIQTKNLEEKIRPFINVADDVLPIVARKLTGSKTDNKPTTKAAKFDNIADNHVKKPGMVSKIVDRLKTEE